MLIAMRPLRASKPPFPEACGQWARLNLRNANCNQFLKFQMLRTESSLRSGRGWIHKLISAPPPSPPPLYNHNGTLCSSFQLKNMYYQLFSAHDMPWFSSPICMFKSISYGQTCIDSFVLFLWLNSFLLGHRKHLITKSIKWYHSFYHPLCFV